jgi:hypothetical protein
MHCRNCKRLREFEEIEILRQSNIGDFEHQGGKVVQEFGLSSVTAPPPPSYVVNLRVIIYTELKPEGHLFMY